MPKQSTFLPVLLTLLGFVGLSASVIHADSRGKDEKSADNGWQVIFDGTSLDQFRGLNRDALPEKGWSLKDGCLHHSKGRGGGDIVIKQPYSSFDFRFEWKISKAGNSGVKYRVAEAAPDAKSKPTGALGLEYQILDDEKHHDGKIHMHRTADLYDLIEANDKKQPKPVGEWNTSRIVLRGNQAEHWLNGERVVSYDMDSDDFKERLAKSKYKNRPEFGKADPGFIAFQDHGNEVWYRNMRIKELD